MFRTAATKLAHNSTIPALAGNSDLKPLQEVITAEKLVLQSLQKLSTDFGKSSEAMRAWASGEGEDLGDTFSACAVLLNHWVSSLASFASHITYIRECLKAVRTREEALDEMHRRRRSLMSKADSADKKLNRMGPENKNLRQQTDLLTGLREQIRTLDVEIMNEEASLGDWKRVKAREWMGVLFGGLLECSEKGAVVATFGRTIIGYVSTEKTQPGLPRALYTGHSKVEPLVVEAELELHKISFISEVGDGAQQPSNEYRIGDIPGLPPSSPSSPARPTLIHPSQPYASSTLPSNPLSNPNELSDFGEFNPYSQSQTYTSGQRSRLSSLDQPHPTSPTISSPFAPFPQGGSGFTPGHQPHLSHGSIRSGSGFTPGHPPPTSAPALHPAHSSNNSASGFIPEHKPSTGDTFSSSIAKALGDDWSLDESGGRRPPRLSVDGPPPSYATNNPSTSISPNPPRLHIIERKPVPTHVPETSDEDDDGVGLSYLNPTNDDGPSPRSHEKRLSDGSGDFQEDRKVRWGSVRDVDTELEKRYAEETRNNNEVKSSVSPARYPETPSPAYQSRSPSPPMPEPHPHAHQSTSVQPIESPTAAGESQLLPELSVEDEGPSQLDERSLNALAAREISKQMEMSSPPLSPPSLPFAGRRSVSPRPLFTSETPPYRAGGGFAGPPPPPPPPPPQFANSTLTRELTPSPKLPQPPPPPPVTLPHSKSMDSPVSDLTQQDDVYRTPPEYLRNDSIPPSPSTTQASLPPIPQVTSTLSSPPSTPTTTKKIPAAAFRRPGVRGLPNNVNLRDDTPRQASLSVGFRPSPGQSPSRERGADESRDGTPDNTVTPLNMRKKSLPAVPAIFTNLLSGPRGPGVPRSISSPFPNLKANEDQPILGGGDDEFDYVSAYLNEDEQRQSGTLNGATNDHGHVGGGPGPSSPQNDGYGSGRFATRLDD